MAYLMAGAGRRALGFTFNTGKIDYGALTSGSDDATAGDSGISSDIVSGMNTVFKSSALFTEGILSDIADGLRDYSAGGEASESINTQGVSDEQIEVKATKVTREQAGAGRDVQRRQRKSPRDFLPEGLRDRIDERNFIGTKASKKFTDRMKAAQEREDLPPERKKSTLKLQDGAAEESGVPSWVWLVAAGAVVFAVYGRKK